MGCTVFDYIKSQRLIAAENMLIYSSYNCTEIAAYLAFPSASYMGKEFREKHGMTPLEYRKKIFVSIGHWNYAKRGISDKIENRKKIGKPGW